MKNGDTHLRTAMSDKFSINKNMDKLEKEAVNRNTKTMVLLVMTLTTCTYRVFVNTSKMSNFDWYTASAWDVMCRLEKKHKHSDTISAVELNVRLSKLRIKETDHHGLIFEKLAEIYIAYGCQLDEARQVSEIVAKSPIHIYNHLSIY